MSGKPWVMRGLLVVFACALAFVTACSPDTNRLIVSLAEGKKGATLRPSETIAFTMTVSPTLTATPTPTPGDTATPVPTATATPTPIPTYVKLRAEVIIQQAVCHYGPGQPYLYKYGVYQGNRLEVIRRVIGHNYVEIQAIGGHNPCWVRLDYLKLNGDWMNLEPVAADEVVLPITPYYGPPAWVRAERNGDEVRVTYSGIKISPGKDSLQTPYIVEAWVCQGGQQVFIPAGSWTFAVTIRDEAGCAEPSRARLLAAEKHGYTRPVEIDWPQPEQTGAPATE